VHARTGIALSDAKRELVYGRLARRLRKLKLASFAQYCELVETGESASCRSSRTRSPRNLTAFSARIIISSSSRRKRCRKSNPALRHAAHAAVVGGCSTGEEPYSLAIVMREALAHLPVGTSASRHGYRLEGVATAAEASMRKSASKEFRPNESETVPQRPGTTGFCAASAELKALITFRQLNLLDSWPMKGPFDIIFCRNVVIYFDKATQRALFDRMADLQEPGAGCSSATRKICSM